MLRFRLTPCLLIRDKGLVKTVNFNDSKYVGDPLNVVKIFNEKEVDEIIILDIDATADSKIPDLLMIKNLAAECRMPLCYGGGISSIAQIQEIISLGVEKVALSAAALFDPELISQAAQTVGSQSVVVVIDVKKRRFSKKYDIYTHNGTKKHKKDFLSWVAEVQSLGAGEIVINSIDRDGTMNGYDTELVEIVKETISLPLTVLGGAGSLKDVAGLIKKFGIIGAAAGSLFVFKGKYKAVLVNYPNPLEKKTITK